MHTRTRAIAATLLAAGLALTAACGSDDGNGGTDGDAKTSVSIRGCTPQNPLITSNTNEVCGGNVLDAVYSKLVHYNADTAEPEMDLAESIETEDSIHFTVKLKEGRKFHDGTDIKAKNFVDTWNWAAYGPNAQQNSYFFEPIEGYEDLQCADEDCSTAPATKEMSGLAVVDDYTFTITTNAATANLPVRLGYTVFSPQPDAFFDDDSTGKTEFAKMPIGSGPYKVIENSDTQIVLEKYADYTGDYAGAVDEVTFRVYNDTNAAYNDVVANNLDLTDVIPSDQLTNDQWKSDLPDRWGVKATGVAQALTFSPVDEQLQDVRMRKAISMAVDRDEICETIFNNARSAAMGFTSPVVDGFEDGACEACKFDPEGAKALYDEVGGYQGTLPLYVNGDGGHDLWANAVCNQLRNNLGIDCVVQTTPDFATLRDQIVNRELKGLSRAGWQMDYPSMENFLTPLYAEGGSSNDSDYANPEFNDLLKQAAAEPDNDKMNELYRQAEALLGQDMPAMPTWYQDSQYGYSTKVKSVKMTPFSTFDLSSIELA